MKTLTLGDECSCGRGQKEDGHLCSTCNEEMQDRDFNECFGQIEP